ncbi:hypothetical protein DH2020_012346 [Rehmannia glutinosa]|uniref:Dof zinc finger protein n=1 Tax=Rehmannia glutinosa TaxID=99300 RepID=A0ABR0WZ38_REHGL
MSKKSNKANPCRRAPPPEPEHLPCPRCDSTNTKFCYYNNYNFSQPRHFCKSCRRYWTHGGTLRDIPVGGGTRKNAKRSRTTTTAAAASTGGAAVFSSAHHDFRHFPASQHLVPLSGADHGGSPPYVTDGKMSGSTSGNGGVSSVGGHTWQLESGDGGFVGSGDCFALPDLAISTPGSVLK